MKFNRVLTLTLGNLLSKGIGLLRDMFFAAWFGTGDVAAAYRIAQTAYLLPTNALIGDSLSAGLLPLYREHRQRNEDEARVLLFIASLYGTIFSVALATMLFAFSGTVATLVAPGASAPAHDLASRLLQIMALSLPFFILSGILSYIEAAFGKFGAIASRPMILNLGAIGGSALAVYLHQEHWLATCVVAGHVIFFIWTFYQFRKVDRLLPHFWPKPLVIVAISRRFTANILPLLALPLCAQLMILTERVTSSWLGTNVIASVDYSRSISETVVQLIAVPLGIFTMASHGGTKGVEASRHSAQIASLIMVVAFPLAAIVGSNAEALISLLFARGAFDAQSTYTSSAILVWAGGALGPTTTAYYLVKALNSQLRNTEALFFTALASATSISCNLVLWRYLGPQTLGISVAAYGVALFVQVMNAFRLFGPMAELLAWLTVGSLLQWLCSALLAWVPRGPHLFFNLLAAGLIWGTLLLLSKPLRVAARPLTSRLPYGLSNKLI